MNNLTKIAGVALTLLISLNLSAQIHYMLTPSTVTNVQNSIYSDYEHLIEISPSKVKTHLNQIITPALYCATCPSSSLATEGATGNSINLTWPIVSTASYYEVQYLNFSSAEVEVFTTANANLTISALPNSTYAFSLVTYFNNGGQLQSSAADVIILEAPVIIQEGEDNIPPITPSCDCDYSSGSYLNFIGNTFSWDMIEGEKYLIHLKYASNEFSKIIMVAIPPTSESSLPMQFLLECTSDISFYGGTNTFYGPSSTEETTLQMFYDEGFYFEYFTDTNPIIGGKLYTCESNQARLEQPRQEELAQIKIHPNPVQGQLQFTIQDKFDSPTQLIIFDQMNQPIFKQAIDQKGTHYVPTEQWPTGNYYLQLIGRDEVKIQSFIKIN